MAWRRQQSITVAIRLGRLFRIYGRSARGRQRGYKAADRQKLEKKERQRDNRRETLETISENHKTNSLKCIVFVKQLLFPLQSACCRNLRFGFT
jgi:hypothetical protein